MNKKGFGIKNSKINKNNNNLENGNVENINKINGLNVINIIKDDLPFLKDVNEDLIINNLKGYIIDQKPFINEPTFYKYYNKLDKKANIYVGIKEFGRTMTSEFEYDLEENNYRTQKIIKADVYEIPGKFRNLKYGDLIEGIINDLYNKKGNFNYILKSYGNKDTIFLKIENEIIYLDPNIFFDDKLKNEKYIIEYFTKFNHWKKTNQSLEWLKSNEGQSEIKNFIKKIKN